MLNATSKLSTIKSDGKKYGFINKTKKKNEDGIQHKCKLINFKTSVLFIYNFTFNAKYNRLKAAIFANSFTVNQLMIPEINENMLNDYDHD